MKMLLISLLLLIAQVSAASTLETRAPDNSRIFFYGKIDHIFFEDVDQASKGTLWIYGPATEKMGVCVLSKELMKDRGIDPVGLARALSENAADITCHTTESDNRATSVIIRFKQR